MNSKPTTDRVWNTFVWAVVGFGFGTVLVSPLILSYDPRVRVLGGMLFGGTLFGLGGAAYGYLRSGRSKQGNGTAQRIGR